MKELSPSPIRRRPVLMVGGAGVAGVAALVAIGALLGDRVTRVDTWGLEVLRVGPGGAAGTVVAVLSDGLRLAAVGAAAAAIGWLLWRGRGPAVPAALGHIALFLVLAASSELLKDVFARPHPGDPAGYSYPSTHVAMVTAAVVVAASILAGPAIAPGSAPPRWLRRLPLATLAAAALLGTAATRVVLAEHHLTDVLGTVLGYAGLGLLGALLLRVLLRRLTPNGVLQ